jgi:hypothetical protein
MTELGEMEKNTAERNEKLRKYNLYLADRTKFLSCH